MTLALQVSALLAFSVLALFLVVALFATAAHIRCWHEDRLIRRQKGYRR